MCCCVVVCMNMKLLFSFACSLFAMVATPASADVQHGGTTSVSVKGQSGKIDVVRGASTVTIDFDSLHEVDVNGNIVGKSGALAQKHSINSFATQAFKFSNIRDVQYKNLTMQEFDFVTDVNEIGKMKVVTYIVEQEGSVSTDAETWSVSPGDVKFNIEFSEWTWCSPCTDGEGAFIDLRIAMKGNKDQPDTNSSSAKSVELGGSTLQLSSRVVLDNQELDMPEGYPKIETKGGSQVYVFRFPKFAQKAVYDPLLQMSTSNDAPGDASNAASLVALANPGCAVLAAVSLFALIL